MKYLLMLIAIWASGCTSHRFSEEYGQRPSAPLKSLHIEFIEGEKNRINLFAPAPLGFTPDFSNARQKAAVEIPKLYTLLQNGIEGQLIPMLEGRLSIEKSLTSDTDVARLRIQPLSGVVECGSASLICQASIYVQLRLVGEDLEPIWVATYKVGAPMNAANSSEVTQTFFSGVVERLASSAIIPNTSR